MGTLFGKTVMKMLPAKALRRALVNAASDKLRWKLALPCEEKYWEHYISTAGGDYRDDFAVRMNPDTPLQPHIQDQLHAPAGSTVRILDVGAGPLTVLGKKSPGHAVHITAIDPIANDYSRLLRKHHVKPPVPTIYCDAERLTARFDVNHFDLVYSRNALDHSYNPVEALRQMVAVCKPGCVVMLENLVNEGETEKYYGLHQWNFNLEAGRFVIWNKISRRDVAEELGPIATVTGTVADRWLTVLIRKAS